MKKARKELAVVPEKCIYCGKLTADRSRIINPGAHHELPCCCEQCYTKTMAFIEKDKLQRKPYYFLLGIMVVSNLFLLGRSATEWYAYLPMLGIALSTLFFPYVFARYDRYQALGLRRTTVLIRLIALGLTVFSCVLMVRF